MAENNRTSDILGYLSQKLMKVARDVEEYRTENSVGQLEQIVQILLELEQIDGSCQYEEVISLIMTAVKLLQEQEDIGTGIASPPLIYRSKRGRPSYNIPRETLVYFIENNFTTTEMANLMHVSTRTIANRIEEYDLYIRDSYSKMNDAELDQIVSKMVQEFPDSGYKTILGHLKARGLRIQEKRIQQSMKRVDPFGVMVRKLFMQNHRIQRRQYNVRAPMSLWHVDSNHKLIRWRFVIHAGIDGFSRLPTYILVACDNTAATALMAFKTGVNEYGLPERVRTDKGKENIAIAEYMLGQRGVNSNCHITGRSVHNQRIERFWREIWQGCTSAYYHLFYSMEEQLILNVDNELDLLALHMVFLERMKQSLQRFCTAVAHRPLRTEGNKSPMQLWILGQGLNPREELSQEEAAAYGIDFAGPLNLNPEEEIVVPPLIDIPEHILIGVQNITNRAVDNVFEVDTYISVKNYLYSQT